MKQETRQITISEYEYQLPPERIAAHPLPDRTASRLLVYRNGLIHDGRFYHLPQQIPAGTLLVLNNTRVLQARIIFQKPTGGQIEIFLLEPFGQTMEQSLAASGPVRWQCLIGGASKWKPGQVLQKEIKLDGEPALLTATYIRKDEDSFVVEFAWQPEGSFAAVVHEAGAIPLPPYIKREALPEDAARYQTVFGRNEGSVAAPTAALHFSPELLDELRAQKTATAFITLHVGAGTFKPVKSATLADHHMHQEPFAVTLQVLKDLLAARQVIAVGTTSLRTLESLHWMGVKLMNGLIDEEDWSLGQWESYDLEAAYPDITQQQSFEALINWMEKNERDILSCRTSLLIAPGYRFKVPAGIITNFHQPQSTLLLLISAFIGPDWRKVYDHALENNYRFLSYGDSSLLWRNG